MRHPGAIFVICLLSSASAVRAGVGPENTLVVVNADSFASKAVANEYVLRRNIPPGNLVELHLNHLQDFEQIGVDDFRKWILAPVLDQIRNRGLAEQIDCIAWSSDIPYAVHVGTDGGGQKLPRVATPVASLNGLTFLYEKVLAKDPEYLKLDANHYAQRAIERPRQERTPAEREQVDKAEALARDKKWTEAAAILATVAQTRANDAEVLYDLACCLASSGKVDEAMTALQRAVDCGFWNVGLMRHDSDLKALRQRADFQKLLDRIKPPPIVVKPSRGFSHAADWDGHKYYLSTMLAVTSGRGNSVGEACEMIRRCVAADGTRPQGTIYYLLNGDIRSTTRQWGFQAAVNRLRELGTKAEMVNGVLPQGKADVAGAMIGSASFDWAASGSTILPGAICEHLTSLGGVLVQNGGQTPISALIRAGAGGSSGTVTEPFAIQAKFPTPFVHVYYIQGATLAEAFYESVAGPYQLLIIGDPLCRPWSRIPTVVANGVGADQIIQDTVTIRAVIEGDESRAARFELFVDGQRRASCGRGGELKLDAKPFATGYHELRIASICSDSLQTQGQCVLPVYCREVPTCALSPPPGSHVTWGRDCKIDVEMAGVERVGLYCGGEPVGTLDSNKGTVTLDTCRLGMGTVQLYPVGFRSAAEGGPGRICAKPFTLTVDPPDLLPGQSIDNQTLAKGLLLHTGERNVVLDAGPLAKAVSQASPQAQQPFTLEGYFDVSARDLYQFQLRFNGSATLEVDAVPLRGSVNQLWSFFPVHLAPGTHHVRLNLKPRDAAANIELRFGNQGAATLKPEQFRCRKP